MNCQDCIHNKKLTGTHHIACNACPKELEMIILSFNASGVFFRNPTHMVVQNTDTGEEKPLIDLNPHGVSMGWALWPFNFDPIWVNECLMYQENTNK